MTESRAVTCWRLRSLERASRFDALRQLARHAGDAYFAARGALLAGDVAAARASLAVDAADGLRESEWRALSELAARGDATASASSSSSREDRGLLAFSARGHVLLTQNGLIGADDARTFLDAASVAARGKPEDKLAEAAAAAAEAAALAAGLACANAGAAASEGSVAQLRIVARTVLRQAALGAPQLLVRVAASFVTLVVGDAKVLAALVARAPDDVSAGILADGASARLMATPYYAMGSPPHTALALLTAPQLSVAAHAKLLAHVVPPTAAQLQRYPAATLEMLSKGLRDAPRCGPAALRCAAAWLSVGARPPTGSTLAVRRGLLVVTATCASEAAMECALSIASATSPAAVAEVVSAVMRVTVLNPSGGTAAVSYHYRPSAEALRAEGQRAADAALVDAVAGVTRLFGAAARLGAHRAQAERLVTLARDLPVRLTALFAAEARRAFAGVTPCRVTHNNFNGLQACGTCREAQYAALRAAAAHLTLLQRLHDASSSRLATVASESICARGVSRVVQEHLRRHATSRPPPSRPAIEVPEWMGFAQPQCDVRTFEEVDGARATASPSPPPPPSEVDGTVAWLRDVVGGDGALADDAKTRARAEEIDGAVLTSMSEDEIGEVLAIDDALDSVADEAALLRVIARVRVVGALAAAAAKEPEIAPSSPAPPSASAHAEWLRATRLRFMHDGDGEDDDDESSEGVADVAPPQPTVGGRLEVLYDSACWWPATVVAIKSGAGPDPAAATLVTVRFDDGEETEEVTWP